MNIFLSISLNRGFWVLKRTIIISEFWVLKRTFLGAQKNYLRVLDAQKNYLRVLGAQKNYLIETAVLLSACNVLTEK